MEVLKLWVLHNLIHVNQQILVWRHACPCGVRKSGSGGCPRKREEGRRYLMRLMSRTSLDHQIPQPGEFCFSELAYKLWWLLCSAWDLVTIILTVKDVRKLLFCVLAEDLLLCFHTLMRCKWIVSLTSHSLDTGFGIYVKDIPFHLRSHKCKPKEQRQFFKRFTCYRVKSCLCF